MGYVIAIVGALGNVGSTMREILADSDIEVDNLVLMDIAENAGKSVEWCGKEYTIVSSEPAAFEGVDIALMSAGGSASKVLTPEAVKRGCIVIDNSTAFRMDPSTPLVVPEVNPEALDRHKGIISNPNCSTIQMVHVLKPLHDTYGVKRVVASTYQAVSGSGKEALDDMFAQFEAFMKGEDMVANVYAHQVAFNALPHIDVFMENGYTKEEMKMIDETKKILDPSVSVTTTTVRIPVVNGHSESLNIETEKPFDLNEVTELLAAFPGIEVVDEPKMDRYPLAIHADGKDPTYVGRLRRDHTIENGLNMWCVSDNLRKGAALNTIQIAQALIERDLVRIQ